MDLALGQLWLILGTYAYCVGSGFIPVMNAEVYLLAVSATSSQAAALPLILAASLGQMTAKAAMYLAGRGVLSLPMGKYKDRLDAAAQRLQASRAGPGSFIFLSASTGFPPFYVISIVSGTLRIPFPVFFFPGFAGRLIRFAALVLFPQAVKGLGG